MPAPSNRGLVLVLFLGVLMAALDIAVVGPVLPAIRETFDVDERSMAWVFNTFVLFNLIGVPLMARLSDVVGRRSVYMADVALFAVGALVVALAPTFQMLLVGRMLQGLGASGIFPVASAVVGDTVAPERRGRVLGLLGAVFGLAFMVGPAAAGILLRVGWQWVFVLGIPLALVVLVGAWRVLPSAPARAGRTLDAPGLVLLAALLGALAWGLNGLDAAALAASLASPRVWPFLLAAVVLVPVFVRVERRAHDPVLRIDLFRSRQVGIASALAAGAGLTEAAFVFMPALAGLAFAVSKSEASFMLLPLVGAVTVGSPVCGRLIDRVGPRPIVIVCTGLLAAGLGLMAAMPAHLAAFYAASVAIGFGLSGLLGSSLSYILLAEARADERAVSQGVITLFISIGQLIAGAFIGALAASSPEPVLGYRRAFAAIAVVALVLLVLGFGLRRLPRARAETEETRTRPTTGS